MKYEIVKCDPAPAGGWIVRLRASAPELDKNIYVEKESVLSLPDGGDPVQHALTAVRSARWKVVLDKKLSTALMAAGKTSATEASALKAPLEVSL